MSQVKRCYTENCKKKISVMSFTCKFCHEIFCYCHQLPENHKCDIKQSDVFEKFRVTNNINYTPDTKENVIENKGRLTKF